MKYVDEAAFQRRQSQTEDDNPPSPVMHPHSDSDPAAAGGAMSASGLKFQTPHTPPSNPLTPASPHNPGSQLQSPPSLRQPSPAPQPTPSPGFMAPSPANPAGSVGSPFPSVQSPMAGQSPRPSPRMGQSASGHGGGPSQQSLSARILPQRLWAGAHPTPLTYQVSKATTSIPAGLTCSVLITTPVGYKRSVCMRDWRFVHKQFYLRRRR